MQADKAIKIPRVWRSQISSILLFLITAPICLWLSIKFPASVIAGPLFSLGDNQVILRLPLFWFVPAFILSFAAIRVFDVSYVADARGIESKIGILSLSQTITRIRYEDIRSIDTRQSLTERLLGIGRVDIGTAASAGLEMSFIGITRPLEVQKFIQFERDKRLKKAAKSNDNRDYNNLAVASGE